MSNVSAVLTTALEEMGITQTALAAKATVDLSMMNRYTRGTPLGADNLLKLAAVLPAPHDAELVAAYLRDALPPQLAQSVLILTNGTGKVAEHEDASALIARALQGMDAELRRDVLFVVDLAARETAIGDIFRKSAEILRGRQ